MRAPQSLGPRRLMTHFLSKFRQARGSLYEEGKESSLLSGSLYSIQENEAFALPVPSF